MTKVQDIVKIPGVLKDFTDFRKVLDFLQDFTGLPVIPRRFWCFNYQIYFFPLLISCGIISAIWCIIYGSVASGERTLTFYSIVVFVAHIQILAKMLTLILNRDEVTEFMDWFQDFYSLKVESDEKVKKIFQDRLTSTLNVAKICSRAMVLAYGSTCVSLIAFLLYKGDAFIYRFPFSLENPSQLHLVLLHLFQSSTIFFNTFLVVIEDSVVATIGVHIMGMLRILCDLIRLLDDSSQDSSALLRRIHSLHADIINHNRSFNDLLFHLLFVQLTSSIFLILMSLSAIKFNAVGFVSYFLGGSAIIQLLLICLFGDFIFMRYSDVELCLLLTKWYEMPISDQKIYIQILRLAQKSYGLKAGGMYDVSMPTFIDIMKMTISYCAILFAIIE